MSVIYTAAAHQFTVMPHSFLQRKWHWAAGRAFWPLRRGVGERGTRSTWTRARDSLHSCSEWWRQGSGTGSQSRALPVCGLGALVEAPRLPKPRRLPVALGNGTCGRACWKDEDQRNLEADPAGSPYRHTGRRVPFTGQGLQVASLGKRRVL